MNDLTQRQIDVLKAIIIEFTDCGEPVGSEILEKKYRLGVSPATIRNEMVHLAKKGYLKKNHFSSGRVPSAKGFRFYIKNVMKEKELSTFEEVAYKNSIWDVRSNVHRLLFLATKVLAQRTGLLSVTVTDSGQLYYSGIANLLNKNEFLDLDLSKNVFALLEEEPYWNNILKQLYAIEEGMMYMLGEEDFNNPVFESCASVIGEFEGRDMKGFIGVIGPKRMYYDEVIPQIRYFSGLIGSIITDQSAA